METKNYPAYKRDGLMVDIVTLVDELSTLHGSMQADWHSRDAVQREAGRRQYAELEETICSKLMGVKYFRTLADSFIKVTKPEDGRPMYLEIVTVYEGSTSLSFAPEFEFQVEPLTGWFSMFLWCQPVTATEYQAAVDLALEKGAVVV